MFLKILLTYVGENSTIQIRKTFCNMKADIWEMMLMGPGELSGQEIAAYDAMAFPQLCKRKATSVMR